MMSLKTITASVISLKLYHSVIYADIVQLIELVICNHDVGSLSLSIGSTGSTPVKMMLLIVCEAEAVMECGDCGDFANGGNLPRTI